MNRYRALTPQAVAAFGEGELELELTAAQEADAINSGLLEIVPRKYRAVSNNYEVPQNEVFEAALLVDVETALVEGGHIQRVRMPAVASEPAKPPRTGKSPKTVKE